jgi:hypothetical protein
MNPQNANTQITEKWNDGKKGHLGRRLKSGTKGSIHTVSRRKVVKPEEVQADIYRFGTACKRTRKRLHSSSLEEDSDDYFKSDSDIDADDESDNQPQVLKLMHA